MIIRKQKEWKQGRVLSRGHCSRANQGSTTLNPIYGGDLRQGEAEGYCCREEGILPSTGRSP